MHAQAKHATGRRSLDSTDASIGRAAVRGAVVGYFVVMIVIGGIVFATGAGLGTALTVGAFAGIWGGPGWGGMMAAQVRADRLAEGERHTADSGGSPDFDRSR